MAYEFYVTIDGAKQGHFKGSAAADGSEKAGSKDKISGIRFRYEVSSPRDTATGQVSGKRQHKPVTFTKRWDAASPQILSALYTNEVLKSVLFEFVRTDAQGAEEIFHTVKLVNAAVSAVGSYVDLTDASGDPYDANEMEDVTLAFQRIEVESRSGGTMAADDWHK
jgi:type VI secretion system secreted protein Hcp